MAFYLDLLLTFLIIIFLNQDYIFMEVEDMSLLIFFVLNFSYSEHQKHDLEQLFNKIYILNSIYLIFDCKAFIDIFMVINNMVFLQLYLHNHKYVVILLQFQNHLFLYRLLMLKKYFEFLNLCEVFFYHEHNSLPEPFELTMLLFGVQEIMFQVIFVLLFYETYLLLSNNPSQYKDT